MTIKKSRLTIEHDPRREPARAFMAHIEIFHEPGTASDDWHVGEAADYKTAILRAAEHLAAKWSTDLAAVPRDRDFLIRYDDGRITLGHYLDNSKSKWPFEGVMPRPMFTIKVGSKITHWREIPEF